MEEGRKKGKDGRLWIREMQEGTDEEREGRERKEGKRRKE